MCVVVGGGEMCVSACWLRFGVQAAMQRTSLCLCVFLKGGRSRHLPVRGASCDKHTTASMHPSRSPTRGVQAASSRSAIFLTCGPLCCAVLCCPPPCPHFLRCEQLLGRVSSELRDLNLYNILEDCHHDTAMPPALRAAQADRLAELRQTHRAWPLTGSVQQGQRVHNWATLLGHNPPCTVSM